MTEAGNIRISMPQKAKYIIKTITDAGFEAYVVGGCVRDSILGREPEDWDITTSARPEQVKALFPRTIDTGIRHGTVTVMLEKEGFEVTTYRVDGKYEDSRHPKEVIFTPSLKEDLRRRDFTINAMAYNEESGLVDIFGGMEDIERGIIRCVGDAEERFGEDALRIMRAIRFSAQLGYKIEEDTKQAIRKLAGTLERISAERIQVELVKLLVSPHPDYLRDAYDMGVTKVVLPEFDVCMRTPQFHLHHMYNVGEHILHSLTEVEPDRILRLAMLLHDIGKPAALEVDEDGITHFHNHNVVGSDMAREILQRLRFDNDTINTVCRIVMYHDYGNSVKPDMRIVRRAVNKVGEDIFPLLFPVKRADILAQSDYMRQEKLDTIDLWEQLYHKIVEEKQCVSLKTLAVTGRDLIALGFRPGPDLGKLLNTLLELVLERPEYNTKEKLLEEAMSVSAQNGLKSF
ncbi:MAG: CCA tRNA nucleotidyltransferase [Muribaculum sp.]|nr:CCA tRNA nucleotidyltransferase [Muribaculum sp.]